jgi:hypothetical protein
MKKAAESTARGKRLKVVKAAQIPDAGAAKPKIRRNSKFKSLGTKDTELQMQFLLESFGAMGITAEDLVSGSGKATSGAKRIGAAISGIDPQDEIQGMLAIQLFATHCMSMEFSRRAMHPEQRGDGVDANVARVTQFMKIFLEQVACLQKLRGRGSQQKVVVEHVHVHQGGQAIVGTVTPGGEGEGES